jgi:arylamine N-acetyltransferase
VPWESVSRILKRHVTRETKECPRLPEELWNDAMQSGCGGTCYESSLAFHSLLISLGYEGYLTVNDMGTTRGCHAAIVTLINGQKYLVDITIPVHAAMRIDPSKTVRRNTPFLDFALQPLGDNKYEVMRSHHPRRNAFTLIDVPVEMPDYRTILENDYGETGLFLKSVVMVKIIDDKTYRFFSDHQPYELETFDRVGKKATSLEPETLPSVLAALFQIPEDKIAAALMLIQAPLAEALNQNLILPRVLERNPLNSQYSSISIVANTKPLRARFEL